MEVLEKIAEMAKEMSWHEIMERFILPQVLKKGGQTRDYQISDEYMTVVAEYAQIIWQNDRQTADILIEFAMQRISYGAVKHKYQGVAINVPQKYVYYSTFQDHEAPMSDACFDFLQRGLPYAFVSENAKVKKHAFAILFGLIYNLDFETGEPLNGYALGDIKTPAKEVQSWAWETALIFVPFEEFWPKLVDDNWLKYKRFFVSNWEKIGVRKFHKKLAEKMPPQKAWQALALDGWERHIGFFHDYWPMVDKDLFFETIGVSELAKKVKISLKIKYYSD